LSGVYLTQSLSFIATGQLPEIVIKTGHPTCVVFALDLSLVVTVLTMGAIWLWQRRLWGYALALIVNIKGAVYMLALSAATVVPYWRGSTADPTQVALWLLIGGGHLLAGVTLLRGLQPASLATQTTQAQMS
jgi:hypothetical protein